jgi:phosphatidylserine synthase
MSWKDRSELSKWAVIAQWFFGIPAMPIALVVILSIFTANWREENGEFHPFVIIILWSLTTCITIACITWRYFRRIKNKTRLQEALECALWWTNTGLLYISVLFPTYVALVFGCIFLLFAFFVWLECGRLLYLSRRGRKEHENL